MVMGKFSLVMETLDMVMEMALKPFARRIAKAGFDTTNSFSACKNRWFDDIYEIFIEIVTISN
jgi:hypothetical protein